MNFLYEIINAEFGNRGIQSTKIPKSISENLKFKTREYQDEAFKRFICLNDNEFKDKPNPPLHAMFNMATGSGKTLIMAGLMLYLFEKGYNNFIFFVNSENIIKKTKDNFLNKNSNKYLFNERIFINQNEIFIKECENFENIQNKNEINIKFCTIHMLHSEITNPRENSLTNEDFKGKNIVLIADEAHHLNSSTKSKTQKLSIFEKPSWENTIDKILASNHANILLEFSATLDSQSQEIIQKYKDKIIYKYDLKAFREQGFSKEIQILKSDMSDENKMLSAVILNLYRSILAAKYSINLKPVILFKAQKTIAQSKTNEEKFRKLIDNINADLIDKFQKDIKNNTLQKAFKFFKENDIQSNELSSRIKDTFKSQNCISVNDESSVKENQILVNSLEDKQNPIRVIFAVNKLNEGWDVLNLFDIVRLYQTRDSNNNKPGKTTISEAQLIGRGARYFPFATDQNDDKFRRKFDKDIQNELRILEEIYYHTNNDSKYISELKTALSDIGIYDERIIQKQLLLKDSFKQTNFYQNGVVWHNNKILVGYNKANFKDIKSKINFKLCNNTSATTQSAFENSDLNNEPKIQNIKTCKIPKNILRSAMSCDEYFHFENLRQNVKDIKSTSEFLEHINSNFEVNFIGEAKIENTDFFMAAKELLEHIKSSLEDISKYKSSDYESKKFKDVFKDKILNIAKNDERANEQENIVKNSDWYIFNANYGTSEEKAFVEFFSKQIKEIEEKFSEIYLVRNERELKIYDEKGNAFEPDFLLFCKDTGGNELNYQVFIEPKGDGFIANDAWKEQFLQNICDKNLQKTQKDKKYKITAIPKFYNKNLEDEFLINFKEIIF